MSSIRAMMAQLPTRAWRLWMVGPQSGCLASPMGWQMDRAPSWYPNTLSTPDNIITPNDGKFNLGRLFAFTSRDETVAALCLAPLPPELLAYGEVELMHAEPVPGHSEEISTSTSLRVLTLHMCQSTPNGTISQVRDRYPEVRISDPWPKSWWTEAAQQRDEMVKWWTETAPVLLKTHRALNPDDKRSPQRVVAELQPHRVRARS